MNLLIRRALSVIRFNFGPGYFAVLIYYVNGWMWYAVNCLSLVRRIAETVRVNDLVFWIAKEWKVNPALAIRCDLLREALADVRGIHADCVQCDVLTFLQQRP